MKLITVTTPCFNEEGNVEPLYEAVRAVFEKVGKYDYEHIFIDNASSDRTQEILKRLAANDKRVKVIINMRNFGVWRSPVHALYQARGAAIIPMCADFQDPPDLIPDFLEKWEQGYKVVAAVKKGSKESLIMRSARKAYYRILCGLADIELIKDFTGYGLYDKQVIDLVKSTGDHYPYVRGLISEMGFPVARVEYVRPGRKHGFSKHRLYDLYSQAMNGIVNHSKVPLRMATFLGFTVAFLSIITGLAYACYKLLFWSSFSVGVAPALIGGFLFTGVQLVFLGILGEYVGAMHSRMFQNWLVIERERINFDDDPQ
jgi:glycosyltransferase involved in cell wall biosynthesis